MTVQLKPYPKMKDSGVAWLGDVPEHWEVLPNRAIFSEVKERDHPEEQLLSVTIMRGVIPHRTLLADTSKRDSSNQNRSAYKLVRPGDIAYNKMRAWEGALGVSDHQGIVSPAYVVQRPGAGANPRYLHYLLRTPAFVKEAQRWSYGITSDMWSLRPEHFRLIYACLPPHAEQTAIVRVLDRADRRIRLYIHSKQHLLNLLQEQKQVIIHQAVTRGLDPNVRLKPSGVAWLGEIPDHWDTLPNGRLFSQRNEIGFAQLPILEVSLRTGVRVRDFSNVHRKQVMTDRDQYKRAIAGDIAYNMMRMWQGAVGVAPVDGLVSPAYVVAKPFPGTAPRYFVHLFRTAAYMQEVDKYSRGIVKDRNRLYWEDFKRMTSCRPPLLEQQRIADVVDASCADIDSSAERVRREIELLREYRTRVIADVVTGKLDVREASANLPAGVEEPEQLDEADDMTDAEDATTDDVDAVLAEEEVEA